MPLAPCVVETLTDNGKSYDLTTLSERSLRFNLWTMSIGYQNRCEVGYPMKQNY